MARSRTKQEAGAAERPQKSPRQATAIKSDIAQRAYDRYLARGREHGHDIEDWVQAERELKASL